VTAVTPECKLNGNAAQFKYWFVSGVGIVRQTMTIGGREIESQLTKFDPAK
jgi:hypothetical protein